MGKSARTGGVMNALLARIGVQPRGKTQVQFTWNGRPATNQMIEERTASTPGAYTAAKSMKAQVRTALGVKSAGVRKPARKGGANGGNANDEGNERGPGGAELFAAGERRVAKKMPPSARIWRAGAMVVRPTSRMNRAAFQLQALFSEPGFQSYSGGELETRAIEVAVDAAGISKIKFDRSGNSVLHPGQQIFGLRTRTFIFKPRFNLNTLKNDPNPMRGMPEVLAACARSKSKGANHVETDLIEYIPRVGKPPVIRLYELKIGEGKAEGFPAEAYQLLKSKRLLEIEWERLYAGQPKPIIKCYFLAWFFGLHPSSGELTTEDVVFAEHERTQPAIHALLTAGGGEGWDRIRKLTPAAFETVSGLNRKIITAQLVRNRQNIFTNLRKVLATRSRRMSIWRNSSPNTRLALERQRRRLVAGPPHRRPVPLGNLTALQEGRWGDYIRNWSAEKVTVPENNAAVKKSVIDKYKREFSRKWRQSINHLVRSRFLRVNRVGATANENLSEMSSSASNWEKNRNVRGRLTNINDVINKLKIVIQIMAHPNKFSSQAADFIQLRELRPVPGTLSPSQVGSIPTETAEQRNWLQGFVFREPTSAERAAAMANSPELRNLQAQSAALQ
jgi:hypothetical protein